VSGLGTLAAIAARTGGRVIGDGTILIEGLRAIEDVGPGSMTFATDATYLKAALASKAAAVLTDAALASELEAPAKPLVVVESTRLALAALLTELEPPRPQGPFVHPTAAVDPSATIGADVYIGPHVSVGARTAVCAGAILGAGSAIGDDVAIGEHTYVHARVVIENGSRIGARCVLQPGAVIGSDGFGWAFLDGRLRKIPQIGIVELGDDVEIGANTTVDRAQTGVTRIGEGTKIDNLCQIGHNVRIGKHSALAAQNGISGSTTLGDYVRVGGQSGFNGHITIGSRVTVAGGTAVWNDLADGAFVSGRPARKHRDEVRGQVFLKNLPKLFARVDALESARKA